MQMNSGGCCCDTCIDLCIPHGDLMVEGQETATRFGVPLPEQRFAQTNGEIVLPQSTYIVEWGGGSWSLDIGDSLTAVYNDPGRTDATADTTLDGTLALIGPLSSPTLRLCVSGEIPPPGGA